MGKQSIRENKTIYQIFRETAGLTRSEASEKMAAVSSHGNQIAAVPRARAHRLPDFSRRRGGRNVRQRSKNLLDLFCGHAVRLKRHRDSRFLRKRHFRRFRHGADFALFLGVHHSRRIPAGAIRCIKMRC